MPACSCFLTILLFAMSHCTDLKKSTPALSATKPANIIGGTIRGISLPRGFKYVECGDTAYAGWLLNLALKENNSVYLYNGKLKRDQNVQHSVLNIDVGKKDLIQCADAVIKLRADFLFKNRRYSELNFAATSGDSLDFQKWLKGTRWKEQGSKLISYKSNAAMSNVGTEYNKFMELVFSYCGTWSLSKQLNPVDGTNEIQAGDVFIQGGFPGHAVTVMAVANNPSGEKVFLLSQGYMPAQDIHILKNYSNPELSPWFSAKELYPLYTPQWTFEKGSLKRW